jgi:hypothetical protein
MKKKWQRIHREIGDLISLINLKNYGDAETDRHRCIYRQQGDLIRFLLFLKIRRVG